MLYYDCRKGKATKNLKKCISNVIRGDLMNQPGLEPRIQMNIRIDREDKEALEELAMEDRRTLSEFIRLILHDFIKSKGK